jgi:hypothetical protein
MATRLLFHSAATHPRALDWLLVLAGSLLAWLLWPTHAALH